MIFAQQAKLRAVEAAVDRLSVGCGFPIVEDREQVLGTVLKLVERLKGESLKLRAVEAAAQELVSKMDECAPYIAKAFLILAALGKAYSGPNYKAEKEALTAIITPQAGA